MNDYNLINTNANCEDNLLFQKIYILHLEENNIKYLCYLYDKAIRMCSFMIIGKLENNIFITFDSKNHFALGYNFTDH
jgi:hypothetical protein